MGSRYGRNKRRAAREEIAKLQGILVEMTAALGRSHDAGLQAMKDKWSLQYELRSNEAAMEKINALLPFAKAYEQMGRLKDTSLVYGQPAIGIGAIAPVSAFRTAAEVVAPWSYLFEPEIEAGV